MKVAVKCSCGCGKIIQRHERLVVPGAHFYFNRDCFNRHKENGQAKEIVQDHSIARRLRERSAA